MTKCRLKNRPKSKGQIQRELEDSWEKLLSKHAAPLTTKKKRVTKKPGAASHLDEVLKQNQSRLPNKGNSVTSSPSTTPSKKQLIKEKAIEQMGREEYERREAEAKEVKHCVMNNHKSGYILVTDPEMVPLMGKKVV